jgi:tetratricopeptide (TPR) repeat protein
MGLGQLLVARERLERALRIEEAAYGSDHPEVALTLSNLGLVLRDLGELPAARQQLERSVGIYRRTRGTEHSDTQWAQRQLDRLP